MREEVEIREKVSTHSRAEAAALALCLRIVTPRVSTHSRAEAAAYFPTSSRLRIFGFQHTAARRRLLPGLAGLLAGKVFQHTAARRRLPTLSQSTKNFRVVSTHSRAEAAAPRSFSGNRILLCFNTQPRGGGCSLHKKARKISVLNTVFR